MAAASPDRRAIITEALRKIDDLSARLEIAEKGDTEPIAVVGMGCRLPGGVNTPGAVLAVVAGRGAVALCGCPRSAGMPMRFTRRITRCRARSAVGRAGF